MSRSRTIAALTLALAALAASVALYCAREWREASPQAVASGADSNVELELASTSSQRKPAERVKTNPRAAIASPLASPPLPPADMPLSAQLPTLLERAEARDPAATCRLAYAINRCVEEVRRRETTRRLTTSLEQRGSNIEGMVVGAIASSDVRNELSGGYCDGVNVDTLPNADALLEAAAADFSPRQKTLIALMRSDGQVRRLRPSQEMFFEPGLYAMPQFQADHGYPFLLDGYAAHDPLALEGLVLTHAPGNAIPVQGVRIALPNPRLYVRYASLYRALFGDAALGFAGREMLTSAEARLTPQSVDDIHLSVQKEVASWQDALASQNVRPAKPGSHEAKAVEAQMASCEE